MEELRLVEALASADRVPFKVRVAIGGGQYTEGHELEVTNVGVRGDGRHKGQVTFDYKNLTTGTTHRNWRHDSDARFELVNDKLPRDVETALISYDDQSSIKKFARAIMGHIRKANDGDLE